MCCVYVILAFDSTKRTEEKSAQFLAPPSVHVLALTLMLLLTKLITQSKLKSYQGKHTYQILDNSGKECTPHYFFLTLFDKLCPLDCLHL